MSQHPARVEWRRQTPDFDYDTYDRNHMVELGAGTRFQASSAAAYKGDARHTNPEELLVSALSSCHMLTFLAVAAKGGWIVDSYVDDAVGFLEKNDAGRMAVNRALLRPRVEFGGGREPSVDELFKLHDKAHHACMVANSVTTKVTVEPQA